MKTLPNGLTVFNATPHPITFWDENWDDVVVVETDHVINAIVNESLEALDVTDELGRLEFVTPKFLPENDATVEFLQSLRDRDIYVIGSIIAAQAYPYLVFGMVPCQGYERVPPDQKRMRPDKFTIFD